MNYVLQTNQLSKNYSGKMAVDNVSLNVKRVIFMALSVKTAQAKQPSCEWYADWLRQQAATFHYLAIAT